AEDPLRLESERRAPKIDAGFEDRIPEMLAVRTCAMELVTQLTDEADSEQETRNTGDECLFRVEVFERVVREILVGEAREQFACAQTGDVQRGERAGDVLDLDVHRPLGVPPR